MESNHIHPTENEHTKDNHFINQVQQVFMEFNRRPATMLMVSIETGILRANICQYVSMMESRGTIYRVKTGFCEISKHPAVYYSTAKHTIQVNPQPPKSL